MTADFLQGIQQVGTPNFSWTLSLNGLLIIATIISATATIVKAIRPIVKSYIEIQNCVVQQAADHEVIMELKENHKDITRILDSVNEQMNTYNQLFKEELGTIRRRRLHSD